MAAAKINCFPSWLGCCWHCRISLRTRGSTRPSLGFCSDRMLVPLTFGVASSTSLQGKAACTKLGWSPKTSHKTHQKPVYIFHIFSKEIIARKRKEKEPPLFHSQVWFPEGKVCSVSRYLRWSTYQKKKNPNNFVSGSQWPSVNTQKILLWSPYNVNAFYWSQ